MNIVADIQIIPLGKGTSLSSEIAACGKILSDAGLKPQLHAHGTNVEGEWEAVFGALKQCHEHLHEQGAARIATSIKIGSRTDAPESTERRVQSVHVKG